MPVCTCFFIWHDSAVREDLGLNSTARDWRFVPLRIHLAANRLALCAKQQADEACAFCQATLSYCACKSFMLRFASKL